MLWYLGIILITFTSSFLGTLLVRKTTLAKGWVAHPSADRWHQTPTALHGGVGIFLAFFIGATLLLASFRQGLISIDLVELDSLKAFTQKLLIIICGASIMFVVGLVDDIKHLKPIVKLLGEILAVSIVIFLGISYETAIFPWVGILLSYLWYIGIINAVNLLDNMDGVSSGVVIIGTIGVGLLGVFGYSTNLPLSVFISGLLIASSLGFWLQNKPPAKIFMGDSGSLVIGFIFAAITIPSEINAFYIESIDFSIWDKVTELLIAIILAAIPILDTTLVTITRLMRGQSPSQGGKDHSTHRLAQSGLSNWQTLRILYAVSAVCAVTALIIALYPQLGFIVAGGVFISITIAAVYLASVKIQVDPIKEEGWQQLVTSLAYRLPLVKMVMDVIIISMAFHLAYLIRFDFQPSRDMTNAMLQTMPLIIIACLISNFILHIYDFSWKNAKRGDITSYLGTALLGTFACIAVVSIGNSFGLTYSRGAFVFFFIIYFFALCATRFSYQLLDEFLLRTRLKQDKDGKIPLILYGIPEDAKLMLEYFSNDSSRWGSYKVIGMVDHNESTTKQRINGIPVKKENDWVRANFSSQPEIILLDKNVPHETVKAFAGKLSSNARIRKLIFEVTDL